MAVERFEETALVFKLLEDFGPVSALTFRHDKVLSSFQLFTTSDWNVDIIKAFLRRVVPSWVTMSIKDSKNTLACS